MTWRLACSLTRVFAGFACRLSSSAATMESNSLKIWILVFTYIYFINSAQIPIPNFFILDFCCCHNSKNCNRNNKKIHTLYLVFSQWLNVLNFATYFEEPIKYIAKDTLERSKIIGPFGEIVIPAQELILLDIGFGSGHHQLVLVTD